MKTIGMASRAVLAVVCSGLLMAGCSADLKPTNAKLEKGLNDYLADRSVCLFPTGMRFPYEVSPGTGAKAEKKRMDAMKSAGLLTELDDFETHVARYSLTAAGQRAAPRFCYGHKEVTSVDNFTAPVRVGNLMETTVTYHAQMKDIPVWVRTDEMEAAFPEMALDISGPQEGQLTMATAGAGWQVR
ncbi:MAG TPA: hypothetical protein VFW25_00300 [Silvibacterium sp.]|nr:hypothetical protein [Silvibacterium sp.]